MDTNATNGQRIIKEKQTELFYPELSYTLIGVCFETQNELGCYCREKQYGDRVAEKLDQLKIPYVREYKIGSSGDTVDFLVNEQIILELKAKRLITKADYIQVQRYLQSSYIRLAIVVNFRPRYLVFKRVVRIDKKN